MMNCIAGCLCVFELLCHSFVILLLLLCIQFWMVLAVCYCVSMVFFFCNKILSKIRPVWGHRPSYKSSRNLSLRWFFYGLFSLLMPNTRITKNLVFSSTTSVHSLACFTPFFERRSLKHSEMEFLFWWTIRYLAGNVQHLVVFLTSLSLCGWVYMHSHKF